MRVVQPADLRVQQSTKFAAGRQLKLVVNSKQRRRSSRRRSGRRTREMSSEHFSDLFIEVAGIANHRGPAIRLIWRMRSQTSNLAPDGMAAAVKA
jgi:hypothetical protein